MSYNFRTYEPDQLFLLSPSLDEWLPEKHLARFIDESVELMDLTNFYKHYRAQAVVDCETQIIVGQAVTQDCNDKKQLEPMMETMEKQSGEVAEIILADAGYCSEANLALETEATELFVAVNKEWKIKKAQREAGSPRGRIPQGFTSTQLMERKLLTQRGRKYYCLRGKTVEPVFGQIKTCRGLTALNRLRKSYFQKYFSLKIHTKA